MKTILHTFIIAQTNPIDKLKQKKENMPLREY